MKVLGITGSIGMGKSTIAKMFERIGVPVHDSDACVHATMQPGRPGYLAIAAAFPLVSYPTLYDKKDRFGRRQINRGALGALVFGDAEKKAELEAILHPLVRESQQEFLRSSRFKGIALCALDIPLLYETGAETRVDAVVVASAPYHIQRQRVLTRGISEEKFAAILSTQMPDHEKRLRADFLVDTGLSMAHSFKMVQQIVQQFLPQQKAMDQVQHQDPFALSDAVLEQQRKRVTL